MAKLNNQGKSSNEMKRLYCGKSNGQRWHNKVTKKDSGTWRCTCCGAERTG